MASPARREMIPQLLILGKEDRAILKRLSREHVTKQRQGHNGPNMSAAIRHLIREEAARRGWTVSTKSSAAA